ncbi:hypothetical protein MBLNU457_7136t1 [Dothideomycetes sp. NU457]
MSDSRSVSPSNTLFVSRTKRQHSEHAEAGAEAQAKAQDAPIQPLNYRGRPLVVHQVGDRYVYEDHEQLPPLPANDPLFKMVEEDNAQVINRLLQALHAMKHLGVEFNNLIAELEKNRTVSYGRPITVGVLGDSGAGKTSFLNNFLGQVGLATVDDSLGFSCTQIVTEYRDRMGMTDKYVSEVHFKPKAIVTADIARHFREYYQFKFRGRRNAGDEEEDGNDFEGSDELATQAQEFFLVLFSGEDGFDDANTLEEFLGQAEGCEDERMLRRLNEAMDRIWESLDIPKNQSTLIVRANTAVEMNVSLKRFAEGKSHDCESLWPIVKHIVTYFDSPVLRQGFTIADCPGITDTNKDRRERSRRYLATCSVVIVIANMSRINTDSSMRDYLKEYSRLKTPSNVLAVLTFMDRLESTLKGLSKVDQQRITALEKIASEASAQKARALEEKKEATSDEDKYRLTNKYLLAQERSVRATNDVKKEKLRIRSRNIIAGLKDKSASKGSYWSDVRCFSVGNKNHEKHIMGDDDDGPPVLDPTEDGFTTIRAAIVEMAQAHHLDSLRRHVTETMPISINRITFTLERTPVQRKGDILRIVDDKRKNVGLSVDDYVGALAATFEEWVQKPMKTRVNSTWIIAAGERVDQFRVTFKAPRTMLAFCKKGGVFKPANKALTDWNWELVSVAIDDISGFLAKFREKLGKLRADVKDELREILNDLKKELEANENFGGKQMQTLWNQFELHMNNGYHACDSVFDGICAELGECLQDLSINGARHDFHAAMGRLYEEITSRRRFPKGTKDMQNERWKVLKQGVTQNTLSARAPFPSLITSFRRNFDQIVQKHRSTISSIIAGPFDNIRQDLNMLFKDEDTIDEDARLEGCAALREAFAEVEVIHERMHASLARLAAKDEAKHRSKKARVTKTEE